MSPPTNDMTNGVVANQNTLTPHLSSSPAPEITAATTTRTLVPTHKRSPKDFIFGKVIGEGSFGTVYLAKDIHTSREYAIKVCEKNHVVKEKKVKYIKQEKEVLNMLAGAKHSFVRLFCTFQDLGRLYFVMSYAKNGELLPYINKVGSFDIDCTKFYSAEILRGLEYLHGLGIIHRDLKPENLLLDENMHILITDFGSAKILKDDPEPTPPEEPEEPEESEDGEKSKESEESKESNEAADPEESEEEGDSEESDAPETAESKKKKEEDKQYSFVGTAQYVPPELLTGGRASRATDLWALGCIIYQMVAGLPPFRSRTDYLIFRKIMRVQYDFPDGFCPLARSLVTQLLVRLPGRRLGARDEHGDGYPSIRGNAFFHGINFETLHEQTPPSIYPYLPGTSERKELRSHYRVPDHLEPGLDDKQMTRLLGLGIGNDTADKPQPPVDKPRRKSGSISDLLPEEIEEQLAKQKTSNIWHRFVDNHLILKQGFVNKRKGLFARRRMLLLTTGPHLYYVDPVHMVLKGEIPWSAELRVEPKNFKIFFVHTPNRTYYLDEPEGFALEWCRAIEDMRVHCYGI